ncbi:MAG TPA: transposase [Candidatus Paceibacterota bacterium]|nr:transposase [Candidatus Paceibacterota bacterium]
MKDWRKEPRRRHSEELKAKVLAECARPGASVAAVALSHSLNANVVHKWRRQGGTKPALPVTTFVAATLPAEPQPPAACWRKPSKLTCKRCPKRSSRCSRPTTPGLGDGKSHRLQPGPLVSPSTVIRPLRFRRNQASRVRRDRLVFSAYSGQSFPA